MTCTITPAPLTFTPEPTHCSRCNPMHGGRCSPTNAGTMLTLRGDGFSAHAGDVEVQLGGAHCRVVWANVTHVSCITPRAADLSVSSAATVSLTVSGLSASCDAPCTFGYDRSLTPVITAATVTSQAPGSDWSIELTGAFGTGSDFPSDASVLVGPTPCSRMSQVPWIAAAAP